MICKVYCEKTLKVGDFCGNWLECKLNMRKIRFIYVASVQAYAVAAERPGAQNAVY